ncbi:MAG TPA: glycosyltransferase, partial [Chthoniobacterales bacterium]
VLLIDDEDAGTVIESELTLFRNKLKPTALVLVHGIDLERVDSPEKAWKVFARGKKTVEFHQGIGLGVATAAIGASQFRRALFAPNRQESNATIYKDRASALVARAELAQLRHRAEVLSARQVQLEFVINDRAKAQAVMEGQARALADVQRRFEHQVQLMDQQATRLQETTKRFTILQANREQAQTVMEAQAAQIEHDQAQILRLQKQTGELKKLISMAKTACRKRGRCFDVPKGPKPKRSTGEKFQREIARVPRNLRRLLRLKPGDDATDTPAAKSDQRYATWIAENEPTAQQMELQRTESEKWNVRSKISLLIPVFDTSHKFLDELFQSIAAQSYGNWEACIVDGGSRAKETIRTLRRWSKIEPRIRIERLQKNFGVAENTNRALHLASGDVVALVDHDDVLAPFALYELANAIRLHPKAEFFYSDEDRLGENGARSHPFFKPEWSPELLYSFMYTGHLSAYRRSFVLELGGFRKEFELSQDYDLALRASERAQEIVHIPHVLYHWREHPASGASGGKPQARKTNLAALADAVKRRGLDAEVSEYPTANRVRMRLRNLPRVSVIIPTDSPARLEKCAQHLPKASGYPEIEYLIVTNSALINRLRASNEPILTQVRFVAFDGPFNFSAKCNLGAKAATGERLVFLNDDVESKQSDWIENIIEPLENHEVGAVSPKLLYESGRIQHAGLVTGVRGLIGTAMHQWHGDSVEYSNLAQSMRNVSALSGACLAMRRDVFFEVGGFDETNTPISHSDIDLCFKIREHGWRCVYTPFAGLTHHGHVSIGAKPAKKNTADKCSIFLLQRWAAFTCRDPYFTDRMREWLYADSPMPLQMFASENSQSATASKRDLLFVTHDLSLSGAPIILSHLAKWCKARGIFVTVMSPADGPARNLFVAGGIPLIIDSVIATGYDQFMRFGQQALRRSHQSFARFARNFDCLIASTIFGAPLIHDARAAAIPHLWWIHEGLVGDHYVRKFPTVARTIPLAQMVVTPDEHGRRIFQSYTDQPISVLRYGVPDIEPQRATERKPGPVRFLLLGTVEQRKGQETLLQAIGQIPPEIRERSFFQIVGRAHDARIAAKIRAAKSAHLNFLEEVSHEEALVLIRESDVMLCTSRDETGPLILMEAMAMGKSILSTRVGAVSEALVPEEEALFVEPDDAAALAAAITRLVT